MGFFSWKTSDTKKSISCSDSLRGALPVFMITEDGQIFQEDNYEGYGEFGGKDVYQLIAEMNDMKAINGELREQAIDLLFKKFITNGTKKYLQGRSPEARFFNWDTLLEEEGGLTPNKLVEQGWKIESPNGEGDFAIAASKGIKVPKFVEKFPFTGTPNKETFKKFWDSLPYPKECENQGFFYEEDDEEEL